MRSHQPNALRFILTAYPAFESALEAIREELFCQTHGNGSLIREDRLLQASLADCIQRNFTAIEMNYLVPDTIHFMGTIDALLEDSARGFIQQANSERASRSRRKGGKKVAESDAEAS